MDKNILFFLFLITPYLTFSQINISRISLNYGYVRNYQSDFESDNLFNLSPEIKLGGKFLKDYFEWDFDISYWQDGISKPFSIVDAATYSYSSTNLGFRLNSFPERIPIPIHFMSGITSRFVREKYIGGNDLYGNYRKTNSFILYTIDFGTGIDIRIISRIRVRLDGLLFMPINKRENINQKGWGSSLKLGLDYFL